MQTDNLEAVRFVATFASVFENCTCGQGRFQRLFSNCYVTSRNRLGTGAGLWQVRRVKTPHP
jgi:hypothetical protein